MNEERRVSNLLGLLRLTVSPDIVSESWCITSFLRPAYQIARENSSASWLVGVKKNLVFFIFVAKD